jgi:hypothetical protein
LLDPVLLLIIGAAVLVGTIAGSQRTVVDVDEGVYRSVLFQMQDGAGFYDATTQALVEKDGAPPAQARSFRTPVLATALSPFPSSTWRWLAAIPGIALCLAAALLAGPSQTSRRVSGALTSVWVLVSLPLLYLHHELWGAALVVFAAAALRDGRDGLAAALCLVATAIRELFGLSLIAGLVFGRDRRPWVAALAGAGLVAAAHLRAAGDAATPGGYDPPLEATDPILHYLSPGNSTGAALLGALIVGLGAVGGWRHRDRVDIRFALAGAVPLAVAGVIAGRSYWSIAWAAPVCVAAALALTDGWGWFERRRAAASG